MGRRRPLGIAAADFNRDDHLDIAVCSDIGDNVEVFLGNVAKTGTGRAKGVGSTGGRVLTITATGDTVEQAAARAQEAAAQVTFDGRHLRTDIAAEAGIFA